jgi:hypothetical protein
MKSFMQLKDIGMKIKQLSMLNVQVCNSYYMGLAPTALKMASQVQKGMCAVLSGGKVCEYCAKNIFSSAWKGATIKKA